ncbi:hypothetical protein BH20VER2_BH20VER2_11490 [soil metagenome]|nr:hypothetical protein [Chthoniobacterales bacterium]
MKTLLGCLLCLMLGTAQSFALKGGPGFGTGRVTTTGIYAGVLTPGPLSPGANSIGLFSLTIPRSGLGTGEVVIFTAGQTYIGTIRGTADPDSSRLTAQLDASFPFTQVVQTGSTATGQPTFTVLTVSARAAGRIEGRITANRNVFSTAAARLTGEANVQFSLTVNNPFTQIGYLVIGFKQLEVS